MSSPYKFQRRVGKRLSHLVHTQDVAGSNPAPATNTPFYQGYQGAPADLRDENRKACSGGAGFPFSSSGPP